MNKLIVAEKPSVAFRVATALSEGQPRRNSINGVGYYEINKDGDTIYVVAAAGHLFTIRQKTEHHGFPVFDVEWVASYKVNKGAYFTKKYLDTIEIIGKKCEFFVNACDYDMEGTVIGTNIIKFLLAGDVNVPIKGGTLRRMKFSTTTTTDLLESYNNMTDFDFLNFDAGETRHKLDWMWGINMSRALMHALLTSGNRKVISIGRVQGPTLAILAEREKEIKNFVPKPYWLVTLKAKGIDFTNNKGSIFGKPEAERILNHTKSAKIIVERVDVTESKIRPYPPFDLTSLQLEASKAFKLDPSRTLAIAQSLYEKAYISYPRTSSQKLPYTLNLSRIISELAKNEKYTTIANYLLVKRMFKPAEGMKEDEAHPAVFPTGVAPKGLTQEEENVYDLVVKRFIACFGPYATSQLTTVTLDANGEKYTAQGKLYPDKGWMELYAPYMRLEEQEMPVFKKDEKVEAEKLQAKELQTKPPARFSKASMIALLERKDLGTKATRADIIETLFKRGYVKNTFMEVTGFGMSVYEALHDYCSEILDENFTRQLEKDMEKIVHGSISEQAVIQEGKEILEKIIKEFRENDTKIGKALAKGLAESEKSSVLGICPTDGGNLVIKRSRMNKNFVACTNWPKCTTTYPLPQNALIVPTKKVCEKCHTPFVKVFRNGRRPFEMDLDPNCETKKDWNKPPQIQTGSEVKGVEQKVEVTRHAKPTRKKAVRKKAVRKKAVTKSTKSTKKVPKNEEE